ncbi:MAG: hypothetical protein SH847_23010, partial [Roseiflexaceae bacterium]|nr:hypothetical protein [Roseiflexaceae bacterium]
MKTIIDPAIQGPLDLFQRTYRSLLRSTGEIQIDAMVEPYQAAEPVLHEGARSPETDAAALIYSSLRLPTCIDRVRLLLLGQSHEVFAHHGYGDVETWQPVTSPGRRRKMFFDGHDKLAVLIASPSDLDDLIPILLALQIEWNKLHQRMADKPLARAIEIGDTQLALDLLGLSGEDQTRMRSVWGAALP